MLPTTTLRRRLQRLSIKKKALLCSNFRVGSSFEAKSESIQFQGRSLLICTIQINSSIVDTLRDDEILIARPLPNLSRSPTPDANIQTSSRTSHSESHMSKPQHSHLVVSRPEEPSPSRIQIRLVSAALARSHAKGSMKEGSQPTNGVLAFDGQFVSGHTSLVRFTVTLHFPVLHLSDIYYPDTR